MLLNLPDELFARLRTYAQEVDYCPLCRYHPGHDDTRHADDCPLKWPREPVAAAEALARLTALATEDCLDEGDRVHVLHDIELPEWMDGFYDPEDWKAFVPEPVRDLWLTFEPHVRAALYLVAQAGLEQVRGREGRGEDR